MLSNCTFARRPGTQIGPFCQTQSIAFVSSSSTGTGVRMHILQPNPQLFCRLVFYRISPDPLRSRTRKRPLRVTFLPPTMPRTKQRYRGPSFSGLATSPVEVGYPGLHAGGKEGKPSTGYVHFSVALEGVSSHIHVIFARTRRGKARGKQGHSPLPQLPRKRACERGSGTEFPPPSRCTFEQMHPMRST